MLHASARSAGQKLALARKRSLAMQSKAEAQRKRGEERGAQQAAECDHIIQALEASHNRELNAELRAVIRAASESDASCAQIVGAWATSANVLGCENLFAVMYGGARNRSMESPWLQGTSADIELKHNNICFSPLSFSCVSCSYRT